MVVKNIISPREKYKKNRKNKKIPEAKDDRQAASQGIK